MFPEGLFGYLTTQASVTTILGTSRSDGTKGVFALLAPNESILPYVVYRQLGNEPIESLGGENKLQKAIYRLSYYGSFYKQSWMLDEAVRLLFATWSAATLPDGTVLQSVTSSEGMDDFEEQPHGTIFSRHRTFEFWYVEAVPL